jgi:septal ring factor EnvC (AmiA/AmiB activator)
MKKPILALVVLLAIILVPSVEAQTTNQLRSQVESIRKEALAIQAENETLQASLGIAEARKGEAVANLETVKAEVRAWEAENRNLQAQITTIKKESDGLRVDAGKWRSLRLTFAIVCGLAFALILAYGLGSMGIRGALVWGSGGGVIFSTLVNTFLS